MPYSNTWLIALHKCEIFKLTYLHIFSFLSFLFTYFLLIYSLFHKPAILLLPKYSKYLSLPDKRFLREHIASPATKIHILIIVYCEFLAKGDWLLCAMVQQ